MNIHKNARLTPLGREHLVKAVLEGQTPEAAARAVGVCPRTVRKWIARFTAEGIEGLRDRTSRPHRLYRPTPSAIVEAVEVLRRQRFTGKQIAADLGISPATVSRILRRLGLNRIAALEPAEPVRRYERDRPGELIHIDIKKLGRFDRVGHRITGTPRQGKSRGVGWEYVHVCIDDASRLAFSQILPDERQESAIVFLKAAVAYYRSLGVKVARVMTDNGSCYKAHAFRDTCRDLGLKHIRTRPYTPKTNGKAERFIQTALREWAYAQGLSDFNRSRRRAADLAAPIQLASSPRQPKIKAAHQPPRSHQGQPVEAPQLARDRRARCPWRSAIAGW
jgi:transposase InsO family protein